MRGEYPSLLQIAIANKGSSPHARGIHLQNVESESIHGFIPACAGNTDWHVFKNHIVQVHPRMRGEYTRPTVPLWRCQGSSPHARGIPLHIEFTVIIDRFIPACAGNTSVPLSVTPPQRVHPRMRGEYSGDVFVGG